MILDENQLKQLHTKLLAIMREVHNICDENGIKYTLIGGSLIGAMRHQGFIPWDDDLDIGMMYKDYQKFIDVVHNYKHPWLEFYIPEYEPNTFRSSMKVFDKRTTYIEENSPEIRGVFVDIMPFSYVGNSRFRFVLEFYYHRILKALLYYKNPNSSLRRGPVLRNLLFKFVAKFFSNSKLMKMINHRYNCLNRFEHIYVSDLDGVLKGLVPSSFFDNFVLTKFEEDKFMRISEADAYLRRVFGDYMILPPVNQQKSHHVEYVDFNTPYELYQK